MNNSIEAVLQSIVQTIGALNPNNGLFGPSGTTINLIENVRSDGRLDDEDVTQLVVEQSYDQNLAGNPEKVLNKVTYILQENPEVVEEIEQFAKANNVDLNEVFTLDGLPVFGKMIQSMINSKKKFAQGGQFEVLESNKKVSIGNKEYNLLVFKTESEKEKGLQDVEEMDADEGALFDYSEDPQTEISFWMKDTTIPLDVVFVNSKGVVLDVKRGEPLSDSLLTCTSSEENPIQWVIEVNVNSGINTGDVVKGLALNTDDLDPKKLYVLNEDGSVQSEIDPSVRIFSRRSTAVLIKKAKKANESKSDVDYKDLGRYIFGELDRQTAREPEFIEQ